MLLPCAGTVFGMLSIIGITPLLGFAVRLLPLRPAEYVVGLTIFTVVPTTLGVGVSLAQSAKVSGAGCRLRIGMSGEGCRLRIGMWFVATVGVCWACPGASPTRVG